MINFMQKFIPSKTLLFISTLISIILVLIYNYFLPTLYSAKALVKVGTPTYSNIRVNTEVELLKSNLFISKALKNIDISHFYYKIINYKPYPIDGDSPFKVSITRGYNILFSLKHHDIRSYRLTVEGGEGIERWSYDKILKYGERINNAYFNLLINRVDGVLFDGFDYSFIVYSQNSLISKIKESLDIKRLNNSSIIEINYQDTLPLRAKRFVEELARVSILESKKGKVIEKKPLLLATLKLQNNIDNNITKIKAETKKVEVKKSSLFLNTIIDMPKGVIKIERDYISYILFIILFNIFSIIIVPLFRFKTRKAKITFDEVKDNLDCIIIGLIPYISEDYKDEDSGVATVSMLVSDSFKEVRDNLQFMSPDPTSQIISISTDSTIDINTISNIILNLSNSITYGGQRVVILDLNMQNPSIHQRFNLFNDDGISTVLSHRAMISKVVRYTDNENLDIVTAGSYPPNPWELIDSKRMLEVLEKLRNVYDVIILNMPPLIKDDRLRGVLDIVDVNMYIVDKSNLNESSIYRLNILTKEINNGFSVLFYDS